MAVGGRFAAIEGGTVNGWEDWRRRNCLYKIGVKLANSGRESKWE